MDIFKWKKLISAMLVGALCASAVCARASADDDGKEQPPAKPAAHPLTRPVLVAAIAFRSLIPMSSPSPISEGI